MASEAVKGNDVVSSPLLIGKTIAIKRQQLIGTLTSPSLHTLPLPTLPFDLIPEILCRLRVKPLMQLRCVCKSWKSLISNPKFAKKHLCFSTTCLVHAWTFSMLSLKCSLKSYSLDSLFTKEVAPKEIAQLKNPFSHHVGSCNGIICLDDYYGGVITFRLWNPSVRKFKELPPLKQPKELYLLMHGFGHDPITDNYKVVALFRAYDSTDNNKTDVKVVHTVGTNFWRDIKEFPFDQVVVEQLSGKYVNGTINWLASKDYAMENQRFIASFDLGKESYQKVLLPDYDCGAGAVDSRTSHLSFFGNCLCLISGNDVWIMKEYGNHESWTKLFTISFMPSYYSYFKVIHIFQDGQVLLKSIQNLIKKLIFYNSINGSLKFHEFQFVDTPEICVESLISPCS